MRLCLILLAMPLTACESVPDAPPTVYVTPPEQILECKDRPAKPDPETRTAGDAAVWLTKLEDSWADCKSKLRQVKKFVQESVPNSPQT